MSKSLGNVVAPEEIIKTHGAEILRLLFASVDYTADTSFSKNLLTPLLESYRKIRNTCRFLLGNLYDFDPSSAIACRTPSCRSSIAGFCIARRSWWHAARKAYESFAFHLVVQQLVNFCAVDLSALYLDIVKDRLYCSATTGARPPRRADGAVGNPRCAGASDGTDPVVHRRRDLDASSRRRRGRRARSSPGFRRRPSATTSWRRSGSACWRCARPSPRRSKKPGSRD